MDNVRDDKAGQELEAVANLDLFAEELPERLNALKPATAFTASTASTLTGTLGSASSVSTLSCSEA